LAIMPNLVIKCHLLTFNIIYSSNLFLGLALHIEYLEVRKRTEYKIVLKKSI